MSNEMQKWFDDVIDLLVANGNKIVDDKRWSWDKEGGHCQVTRPLNFALIEKSLPVPQGVILDKVYQRITTDWDYLEIKQRIPFQFVPPQNEPSFKIPSWRPLILQGASHPSINIAAIEEKLAAMGASSVGQSFNLDRYVEPYKNHYRDHTWLLSWNDKSIGFFIQDDHVGVTVDKSERSHETLEELITYLKLIIQDLNLKIWNDQDMEAGH